MLLVGAILLAVFVVPPPWSLVVVLVAAVFEVAETIVFVKLSRRRRIRVGAEALLGASGEVVSACRPVGRVRVHGEVWQARCDRGADAGDRVRVVAREGLVLVVEPVTGGERSSANRHGQ
jgi:membrane-bound serine protease (ClpP class)